MQPSNKQTTNYAYATLAHGNARQGKALIYILAASLPPSQVDATAKLNSIT